MFSIDQARKIAGKIMAAKLLLAILCYAGQVLLVLFVIQSMGCSSTPRPIVVEPAPALREVFRGGEVQGLQNNAGHFMGRPKAYDLQTHVCRSEPIFNNKGQYLGTDVRCF